MRNLPYREGSIFLVPLRSGGYARGVIARAAPKGKILLGYFFKPRLMSVDTIRLNDLSPAGAVRRLLFGDLGLINGEWKLCGYIPCWTRSEWPMPDFVRKAPGMPALLVRYADDDPSRVVSESVISGATDMPEDALYGYGAVEIVLNKLF